MAVGIRKTNNVNIIFLKISFCRRSNQLSIMSTSGRTKIFSNLSDFRTLGKFLANRYRYRCRSFKTNLLKILFTYHRQVF
jgi:hypothetical protein